MPNNALKRFGPGGMFSELSWRKKGVHHSGEDEHAYVWERGIHDFDSMRFFFSCHPKRVWAHSFNPPWSPYRGGAGVHGWVEFQSGVTCGYLHCFESHKKQAICRIDCERGTLAINGLIVETLTRSATSSGY